MRDIRIAAIICEARLGETGKNLDRTERWVVRAKKNGADIVCFPEMNVTGYAVTEDIKKFAEDISGKVVSQLLALARGEQVTILAGLAEKGENGQIFASHLVLGPEGVHGIYRKLYLAPPEKSVFSPGNRIPLFSFKDVTFGIQLCYDGHFPEISTHMALGGADIFFIPHASPRGTPQAKSSSWKRHLPARAYDNAVFVVACNQTGDNGKGLTFPGIAMVIGPDGQIMDEKASDTDDLLFVECKEKDLRRIRENRMHYFLPNRREDLFPCI
jgi:predicted amidohydrolase